MSETGLSDLSLTESQFTALETAGQISLTSEARRAITNIAESWISHDGALQSPRPAKFRARLQSILGSLEAAWAAADLNREGASTFERHMYHWLFYGDLSGAGDALIQLGYLPHIMEFLKKAEQSLPADLGSARPRNDRRFIQYLADQFEACGGKARAYISAHSGEGYAKTPFRQFVHQFYGFLPMKSRRTRRGLNEAIRRALLERRRKPKV